MITPDQDGRPDIGHVKLGNIILNTLNKSIKMSDLLNEVEITKSQTALDNVCSTKKICDSQGPITFGQFRDLVESGKIKRIGVHMGEGAYKAMLRLVPWFIPQLVLAGFAAILTPCVFPMIPMTVSFFMRGNENRGKSIRNGIFFGLSFVLIFTLLGALFSFGIFGPNFGTCPA